MSKQHARLQSDARGAAHESLWFSVHRVDFRASPSARVGKYVYRCDTALDALLGTRQISDFCHKRQVRPILLLEYGRIPRQLELDEELGFGTQLAAGLRALGQREQIHQAKLGRIRAAMDEGDAAPGADDYSLEGLLTELSLKTD